MAVGQEGELYKECRLELRNDCLECSVKRVKIIV